MHRSYQPLKPVANRYLQQRWDQEDYQNHRQKVSCSLPTVDTRGTRTPAHIQLKLKKLQLQDERLAVIDRDNRLLASKLAHIVDSKGLVDHQNQYRLRSLNADRRRAELLQVGRQNEGIYQRITSCRSEYRRQLWLDDWERVERLRSSITRYPGGPRDRQRPFRTGKSATTGGGEPSTRSSSIMTETTRTDQDDGRLSSGSSSSDD